MATSNGFCSKVPAAARSCSPKSAIWWLLASVSQPQPQPSLKGVESIERTAVPKILVVEDNEVNQRILVRRLEKRGYSVVIADDGEAGVVLAQTEAPDLILMDMSLPVLNGWEA